MKESGVLGDIVPNNTNPAAGTATAVRPSPSTVTPLVSANGFGAASFTGAAQPVQSFQSQSYPAAQPSQPETAIHNSEEQSIPVSAAPAVSKLSGSKLPLILTITGVVIFIGGVTGLFIYALHS